MILNNELPNWHRRERLSWIVDRALNLALTAIHLERMDLAAHHANRARQVSERIVVEYGETT